ncbi:hypothetical protein FQR65_LT05756 [Abscondita terminalis]|nr:hypothetical protein FQR65_LT05756 [Abscondita terminalis]
MNNDKQILIQTDSNEDVSIGYDDPPYASSYNEVQPIPTTLPPISEIVRQNHITVPLQKPLSLPQYVTTIIATLSAFSAGTVLGWTSPITNVLENGQYNNITISNVEMGWIGSFVTLGGMITCFPFGIICDIVGRKGALLLLLVPFSVGRFVMGMAAGACCVAAPLYINEIAHKNIRGTLESPYYSLKKGKDHVALKSLQRLRGPNYNVVSELDSVKSLLEDSLQSSASWSYSLRKRSGYKAFIIALALMFFQQLCGINAIIFYTSYIFTASGANIDPQFAAICVGAFQVIATFVSSLIVDRLGRRMLLISSDFVMGLATAFLGLFFTFKDRGIVSDDVVYMLGFLPIVALCVFIIMFSVGLGPIPWMITGEIFSPELKSFAVSCAATLNWFLAFLVTKFFLDLESLIGCDVMFYIFSFISFIGSVFCYAVIPETRGKTIEQVQDELER